ncbi:hypothetical protein AAZX31_14G106800 [Glycine max]
MTTISYLRSSPVNLYCMQRRWKSTLQLQFLFENSTNKSFNFFGFLSKFAILYRVLGGRTHQSCHFYLKTL